MKKYEATFEMNNGYVCSCCRNVEHYKRGKSLKTELLTSDVAESIDKMENDEGDLLYIERLDVSLRH